MFPNNLQEDKLEQLFLRVGWFTWSFNYQKISGRSLQQYCGEKLVYHIKKGVHISIVYFKPEETSAIRRELLSLLPYENI